MTERRHSDLSASALACYAPDDRLCDIAGAGIVYAAGSTRARHPALVGGGSHNTAVLPVARQILSTADAATKVIALGVIGDLGDASDLPRLREIAGKPDAVASRGRGFGFMPVIDLARVAQNAMDRVNARIDHVK